MTATTSDTGLRRLRERIDGDVIAPGDERYDAARAMWNAVVDRRPAAIVRPRGEAGVAAAVVHAREQGLEVAVRCGGHSFHGMTDGGLAIDLSAMNGVAVDPATRRARVGGGALMDDGMRAAAPHGLTMPYGHVSHTGVGGLTLGGGIGWVMRRDGLAVDRLRSARLVTADGDIVVAGPDENPDLFWAIRGGGGNFGVVTEFEFELCPLGPEVLGGMLLHPLDRAADVLAQVRDFMDAAPGELGVYETLMTVPPAPEFPAELRGRPALALSIQWAGDPDEGERAIRPLRAIGRPALDAIGRMTPVEAARMLDPTAPHGLRYYHGAHWLAELPDAAIDALVERHAQVTAPMSAIIGARMGGAVARVAPGETAFAHRGAYRLLWVIAAWEGGDDERHVGWARETLDAVTPWDSGTGYVNGLDADGQEQVRAGYDAPTWRRLVAAKDRWDPDNVFHLNGNVPPSAR
jgi:FAD/FMN-containing dehydrogenase